MNATTTFFYITLTAFGRGDCYKSGMIDEFSPLWHEASALIDYTYAEDLDTWKTCSADGIEINSPVLERLRSGDIVYVNSNVFSFLFVFDLLRKPMHEYSPLVFLSTSEKVREYINSILFTSFDCSDEQLLDRLSSGSVLSKRLRVKRFCEVEDELRELSSKGYKTVVIAYFESLPYLDAESMEKGYRDHHEALASIAKECGLSIMLFSSKAPKQKADAICLHVTPVKSRRLFEAPKRVIVSRDEKMKAMFNFRTDSNIIGSFSIGGRQVDILKSETEE